MKTTYNPLIFGISGKVLTEKEKYFFKKSKPLGIILFARNIESPEQLKNLTSAIKDLLPEVKIFTDQEGGKVQRVKFSGKYPTSEYFAKKYEDNKEEAKKAVKENYSKMTLELKNLGIDSPCGPVCDLRFEGAHDVIGDRAFGYDPEQVVDLCTMAIEGIVEQNGIPVIKHMPGHGRAKVDSHHKLPIVDTELETLEKTDFKTFKELASIKEVWAMTAHIIYTALDEEKPATLSKKVIEYIREVIGFKGKLMSDAINMKALHNKNMSLLENLKIITKETFEAGCDIVLHCSGNMDEMEAVFEGATL